MKEKQTDYRPTDGPTDRPTDRPTRRPIESRTRDYKLERNAGGKTVYVCATDCEI